MNVIVAEKYGFCPGVKNAIKMARETLEKKQKIYSLGSIIHNNDVVRELAKAGLITVESIDQIPEGTVLIRSHGATIEQINRIKKRGLNIVDATCVLVKRLQDIGKKLKKEGYQVVMIGDKKHPEVKAVVGSIEQVIVVSKPNDLHKISNNKKLGIICQTTQSPDRFGKLVGKIVEKGYPEIKVINTLQRSYKKTGFCCGFVQKSRYNVRFRRIKQRKHKKTRSIV
jgi:4-hydroxy-3-methylbut-2-enyl diphosphate reductase